MPIKHRLACQAGMVSAWGMQHGKLITALGGPTAVAALAGVDANTPVKWPQRGIPPAHWPVLIRHARRHGIRININDLYNASPLYRPRRGRRC